MNDGFLDRWFSREESKNEQTQPETSDREQVKHWVQSINDSVVQIRTELERTPSLTAAAVDESFEDRRHEVLSKLDALPQKIIGPLGEIIDLSKREVLAELVRISSRYSAHDSSLAPLLDIYVLYGYGEKMRRILGDQHISYARIFEYYITPLSSLIVRPVGEPVGREQMA